MVRTMRGTSEQLEQGSMDQSQSPPVLVIGVGNDYRSDDAVGLAVVRILKAKELPDTLCLESDGDGTSLIETWSQASRVIIVDAISSGALPGAIHRFDALTQPLPASYSFSSTHAFGVAEAIQLARTLDQLPASLVVYGLEGKNFVAGTELSAEVEGAVQEVVELVEQEVQDPNQP
jgi:hydrogenase maturation protease